MHEWWKCINMELPSKYASSNDISTHLCRPVIIARSAHTLEIVQLMYKWRDPLLQHTTWSKYVINYCFRRVINVAMQFCSALCVCILLSFLIWLLNAAPLFTQFALLIANLFLINANTNNGLCQGKCASEQYCGWFFSSPFIHYVCGIWEKKRWQKMEQNLMIFHSWWTQTQNQNR